VALTKIECPECGAGLKSPDGFDVGESVECPKCETSFTVRDGSGSASTASADKPKKKKKRPSDDGERSYKSSPMRYAVLGVLVVVMVVLGVMLVQKNRKDRETETENARIQGRNKDQQGDPTAVPIPPPPPKVGPGLGVPKNPAPKKGGPVGPPPPPPPPTIGGPKGGDGVFAETPFNNSPEFAALQTKLRAKLLGSWEGTAPDGVAHKVTYAADGKYTLDVGGKSSTGMWTATGLTGGKVLKITRGGTSLKVVFEGAELLHDTETPGVAIVMKKKA
jgi:hypothetical protein